MKTGFYKQPENPLSIVGRLLRAILGMKTAQDNMRDHMFNNKKK